MPVKPNPKLLELDEWMNNIQVVADDQARVLMAAGYMDALLEELLRAKMIATSSVPDNLLRESRALGTFSARTDASVAFGLISPELGEEIHRLRRIRNRAAHSFKPISLDAPPLSDMCKSLRLGTPIPPGMTDCGGLRFTLTASQICMALQSKIPEIQRCRRPKPDNLWLALLDEGKLSALRENIQKHEGRIGLDPEVYDV